ncbi:MAG: 50S ribosomal protein L4 [Phycisphaerae bacterium]|nr:50S ribosomal protein L4 [Phycisphaerae bacterium]
MLEVPVYNTKGEKVDTIEVDERVFGSSVNVALLKQAVVAYHANSRRGTAATKGRAMVDGSTRKIFRQKGTGNARRGNIRTNILRGGGVAFAKRPGKFRKTLPRKMRRAALASAILAKIIGNDLLVLDALEIESPKTGRMAGVLKNLKINRSCLLALAQRDRNIYLSARNIPDVAVRITDELNAFDVATRQKMVVTADAMKALMGRED